MAKENLKKIIRKIKFKFSGRS